MSTFRLECQIKNSILNNHKAIFLYGKNIIDYFHYDYTEEPFDLKDSIYHFFKNKYDCQFALHVYSEHGNKKSTNLLSLPLLPMYYSSLPATSPRGG